jgi:[protein-PII] uridylyltransferase
MPKIEFDFQPLDQALQADTFPFAKFQTTLKQGTALIQEKYHKGVAIDQLVRARARLIDELLVRAWRHHFSDASGVVLVAVGGYGRGELHPASDIDLMLLLENEAAFEQQREPLEAFLTALWDIGLEVGQSVRTITDCVREAEQDITVATNIMESRLLTGPLALFESMREATGPDRIWNSREFFEAKWKEQQARHAKYEDSVSNLEPNIKEGPGGLRDIQMIGWVVKRHFRAETLQDLVLHEFLTLDEYNTLIEGQNFLWRVRFALHTLTGRAGDRLLFEHQRALAAEFGYDDDSANLAVEQFMQLYYRTVMELSRLNEMLLQLFQEAILLKNRLDEPVQLNRRFQQRNGFLEASSPEIFKHTPIALLELFLTLQQHAELKGVRARTIRLIRDHCHLIDDAFRQDIQATSLFMEILRQPEGITEQLRRMNRYGVLAAYIPAFANIVGRMQYDLFHVYTVDEHTLMVIRNLRRLAVPSHNHEYPLCSQLQQNLPKQELIYLAALFHDIAKGRGGNHSELGQEDALEFCRRHHLSEYDSRLVAWLVRRHLLMSMTAQRKDISDPEVIQAFAEQVVELNRLDYLYLLTVADSQATNPKRWNSWKEALLRDLYTSTRQLLQRGLGNPLAQEELISEKQAEARQGLIAQGYSQERLEQLWQSYNPEYFLTHSVNAICSQSRLILDTPKSELPLIAIRQTEHRGGTEVIYYGIERDNLFALSTTLLDQIGLSIVNARIMSTSQGYSLNSFLVLEEDGSSVTPGERTNEILDSMRLGMSQTEVDCFRVQRRIPRQHKSFDTPTRIFFSQDLTHHRTTMRLVTLDRPGLLSEVGQAFLACGISLQHAKISTIGAQVEDIFFITDRDKQPLQEEQQLECLRRSITERLPKTPEE